MADVASGRIEATTQSARKAMEESRLDIEQKSILLSGLADRTKAEIAETAQSVIALLTQELNRVEIDVLHRLETHHGRAQETMAAVDANLTAQSPEERRVGKGGARWGRAWWEPVHFRINTEQ